MSVTPNSLGSNSVKLVYTAGETAANILTAFDTWLVAHGWSLYDGAAGVDTNAYRALNKDASTYKYITVEITSTRLFLRGWESWDSGLHTGTNLCYYSDNTNFAQRIDLVNGGDLYVFANVRYICIESVIPANVVGSVTGNGACAVCEVSRDNPGDTIGAGYPTMCWFNTYSLMITQNPTFGVVSFPRTRDGSTGLNASLYTFISSYALYGGYATNAVYHDADDFQFQKSNVFNNKSPAWTLRCGRMGIGSADWEYKGKIYGIKALPSGIGVTIPAAESIQMEIDADTLLDYNGSNTKHYMVSAGTRRIGVIA